MADPLPKLVDVRKLIAADTELHATEPLRHFGRLLDMLESDAGDVEIHLHFHIDAQGKRRIDGELGAALMIPCQRCLQPMPYTLASTFSTAAVWSDAEAEHLPKHLDPYIVGEGPQDLRELIEDELIMSVPYVSYHDPGSCEAGAWSRSGGQDAADAGSTPGRDNPFRVLERLKPGN